MEEWGWLGLQQVVLDDVADDADTVKVTTAAVGVEILLEGDLDLSCRIAHACACACVYARVRVCVRVHVCTCARACMYVKVHTGTHTDATYVDEDVGVCVDGCG